MNPGLVVKLRPTGPWRIGPDSGARNRVDFIYHSDSLYSAVTAAMGRMGSLEDWLAATARAGEPAVCFGSCFPFVDDAGFVVPPRTVWPPSSPSAMSARVRWRSARFVPLEVVQSMLAGRPLDDDKWSVDGPSECLVPAGRPGPFRTALRWSAAVDRLTGATERHSTACIEFRAGCGLWTVVSFRDVLAHARWIEPVKAAFRLLADSGFGGERSRGWGRAESPEFTEGDLPEMILPPAPLSEHPVTVAEGSPNEPIEPSPEPSAEEAPVEPPVEQASWPVAPEPSEPADPPVTPPSEVDLGPAGVHASSSIAALENVEQASWPVSSEPSQTAEPSPISSPSEVDLATAAAETAAVGASSSVAVLEMEEEAEVAEAPTEVEPVLATLAEEIIVVQPGPRAHWLLSLFTPSSEDSVDWRRGNYTVLARGGRVESAAGSGELKKQIQMVAEGSVLFAEAAPRGSAANVAPDGFAHPVYRAGFALSIPLPEVR
jgi:CRISPR type III-A-associated RAMP protein Csm4